MDVSTTAAAAQDGQQKPNTIQKAVILVLAVSLATNVYFFYQINKLTAALSSKAPPATHLEVGTIVPPITAKNLDGQNETISYLQSGRPTVLYVFTPKCSWCTRNLPNLKALMDKKREEYRFVAVSLSDEGVKEYVSENGLDIPVYTGLSEDIKKTYKMRGTPQTIVVTEEGKVIQSWMGAYMERLQPQVEGFFGVALPGIQK
jgi:peroxiredoxin